MLTLFFVFCCCLFVCLFVCCFFFWGGGGQGFFGKGPDFLRISFFVPSPYNTTLRGCVGPWLWDQVPQLSQGRAGQRKTHHSLLQLDTESHTRGESESPTAQGQYHVSQVPQPTCFCNFQVMCAIFKKVILIQLVLVVQICLYLFSCYSDVPKEDEDVFGWYCSSNVPRGGLTTNLVLIWVSQSINPPGGTAGSL